MPHVHVIFNPKKVSQDLVDFLKPLLQLEVSSALSSDEVREDPASSEDIETPAEQIMVLQHTTHPSDVNVPPLEIYIVAGRPKGRSEQKIVERIADALAGVECIPSEYLGEGQSGIFLTFHPNNGFCFFPHLY
jgi:hypothetical protein